MSTHLCEPHPSVRRVRLQVAYDCAVQVHDAQRLLRGASHGCEKWRESNTDGDGLNRPLAQGYVVDPSDKFHSGETFRDPGSVSVRSGQYG